MTKIKRKGEKSKCAHEAAIVDKLVDNHGLDGESASLSEVMNSMPF